METTKLRVFSPSLQSSWVMVQRGSLYLQSSSNHALLEPTDQQRVQVVPLPTSTLRQSASPKSLSAKRWRRFRSHHSKLSMQSSKGNPEHHTRRPCTMILQGHCMAACQCAQPYGTSRQPAMPATCFQVAVQVMDDEEELGPDDLLLLVRPASSCHVPRSTYRARKP